MHKSFYPYVRNRWLYRPREAYPIIIKGLKSADTAATTALGLFAKRCGAESVQEKGAYPNSEDAIVGQKPCPCLVSATTRWATHGKPSDVMLTPHEF